MSAETGGSAVAVAANHGTSETPAGDTDSKPGTLALPPETVGQDGRFPTPAEDDGVGGKQRPSGLGEPSRSAQELEAAVHENDAGAVYDLLRDGVDINGCDGDGYPFLVLAACYGHSAVVEVLLHAKANANITSADGSTPLQVAAQDGHDDTIEMLLAAKASVNYQHDSTQVTPLFLACQEGHIESVQLLLKARASAEIRRHGYTPLFVAVQEAHLAIVQVLLSSGASQVNALAPQGISCLMVASQMGHAEMVRTLLNYRADPNLAKSDGTSALMTASSQGRADIVTPLLGAKASVTSCTNEGTTAVMMAAFHGDLSVISKLVDAKADINKTTADHLRAKTQSSTPSDAVSAMSLFLQKHGGNLQLHLDFIRPTLRRAVSGSERPTSRPPRQSIRRTSTDVKRSPRSSAGSNASSTRAASPPGSPESLSVGSNLVLERDLEAGETIIKSQGGRRCSIM